VLEHLRQPALDQRAVAGGVLGLDEDLDPPVGVRDQGQELAQRQQVRAVVPLDDVGDLVVRRGGLPLQLLPGPPVQPLELGQLQGRHEAAAVGGPVDAPVVHAHQVTVGGEPDVALERVGADLDGLEVGGEGVLRLVGAGTPVRHHERTDRHPTRLPWTR
jgi:hypothetical protein